MKRPRGVTIIALWCYLVCASVVVYPLAGGNAGKPFAAALVLSFVIEFVLGTGLWMMRNWARISAAIVIAINLVWALLFDLGWPYHPALSASGILIQLVIAISLFIFLIYLLVPQTKRAFRFAQSRGDGSKRIDGTFF
jgi:uncharacterized membrane protein (DUF2068 family)